MTATITTFDLVLFITAFFGFLAAALVVQVVTKWLIDAWKEIEAESDADIRDALRLDERDLKSR